MWDFFDEQSRKRVFTQACMNFAPQVATCGERRSSEKEPIMHGN
jgi:hypothetical protein